MRVCIVYDCLYPWTVGGAERWYRNLAAELVDAGHEVTYLTRTQWTDGEPPEIPGVEVIAVSGRSELYDEAGRRRIAPPLAFGAGVLRHLLRRRRAYDVVHTCAFPYFSLLAARLALAGAPTRLTVDWFEVWSRSYWRGYLGGVRGLVGHLVQRFCVRLTPEAFVFSRLYAERLAEEGLRGSPTVLGGLYSGPAESAVDPVAPREPLVLFAGRHIPEKRVPAIPPAIAAARERIPELRALVLGDGPERSLVLEAIERNGLAEVVDAPGFVEPAEVDAAFARATCLLLPSEREGYGLVVIEAAAAGTPSIVVAGPDNASAELVAEGENGFVAPSSSPEDLAGAIVRVHERGAELRRRTAGWFAENAARLRSDESARKIVGVLEGRR